MLNELENLINFILIEFMEFNEKWQKAIIILKLI